MNMKSGRTKVARNMTLDEDLTEEIDRARGHEPLSSFVNRTLREALEMSEVYTLTGDEESEPEKG